MLGKGRRIASVLIGLPIHDEQVNATQRVVPLTIIVALALLSACTPLPPTEAARVAATLVATIGRQASASPVSTAISRLKTSTPSLDSIAAPTVATTAASATTPAPGLPAPIWWTVRPETTADGRTVYLVDQPEVKEMVGAQYYEILTFYSNQDSPADLGQAAYFSVDAEVPLREASRATAVAQGWYWRIPVPQTLHWEGEPEFSADGSDVTWTFVITDEQITAENLYSRQVALDTGEVMQEVRLPALRQTVFLRYDPQQGRWRLDDAKSHLQLLPTPTPAS